MQLHPAPILAALAVAAALLAPAASAAPRVRAPAPALDSGADAARVLRFWTPRRMAGARPLDLVLDRRGEPRLGFGPAPAATAGASFVGVPAPIEPPYTVNGRLFLRVGERTGYCSGTAIDSPSRQLVLTAGHCLNEGGEFHGRRWHRDLLFVPAYSGGKRPFGAFPARPNRIFALRQWTKQGNRNFDVGAFLASPNKRGVRVADAVGGGAAIALDRPREQEYTTFGYPHRFRWMKTCASSRTYEDRYALGDPGPPTLGIGCRWVPGASGGGWLIEAGTRIDGLTSYGLLSRPGSTFGPYFSRRNVGRLVAGL